MYTPQRYGQERYGQGPSFPQPTPQHAGDPSEQSGIIVESSSTVTEVAKNITTFALAALVVVGSLYGLYIGTAAAIRLLTRLISVHVGPAIQWAGFENIGGWVSANPGKTLAGLVTVIAYRCLPRPRRRPTVSIGTMSSGHYF
jgi:hypothetical protein